MVSETIDEVTTGSVVGTFQCPGGEEIAVAVRLPTAVWEQLSQGLLDSYDTDGTLIEADEPLHRQIAVFLDLAVQEWALRDKLRSCGGMDDDAPF